MNRTQFKTYDINKEQARSASIFYSDSEKRVYLGINLNFAKPDEWLEPSQARAIALGLLDAAAQAEGRLPEQYAKGLAGQRTVPKTRHDTREGYLPTAAQDSPAGGPVGTS